MPATVQRTNGRNSGEQSPAKNSVKNSVKAQKIEEVWSEWQDLNLRPPRPERGALPATLPFRLWTLSRSLLADNFRLMALDRRGPRQSDLWSASPSGKSPFLWSGQTETST
jgi:hypothetical protein